MSFDAIVADFRRELSNFYGYDEKGRCAGKSYSAAPVADAKKNLLGPRDFLGFAIEDANDLEKTRNRVNCLGNCKRAIDSQVNRLIYNVGVFPAAQRQGWDIPTKLKFISDCGIVAPRILGRLNRLRNKLEHEFKSPSKDQTEDALDVATLFISYAELVHVPSLNWSTPSKLSVRYDYDQMAFSFYDQDPDFAPNELPPMYVLREGEAAFKDFYNFLMKEIPRMQRSKR